MAFSITYIIQTIDKFSQPARNIAREADKVIRSFKGLSEQGKRFQQISRGLFLKLALPMAAFATGLLHTASSFQMLQVSFESLLGNKKAGDELFRSMIDLSQRFGTATTESFANAARSLLAVGGQAKQIPAVLSRLADISGLTGKRVENLAVSYGQVFAGGVVRRRFIGDLMRSTNILKVMGDVMGKTKTETMKLLRDGKIGFQIFRESIIRMTSAGGLFFKGQERGAQTLHGSYMLVKDSIQIAAATMGGFIAKQLNLVAGAHRLRDVIMDLDKNFAFYSEKYGPLIRGVILLTGAFLALMVISFTLGAIMRIGAGIVFLYTASMWLLRGAGKALIVTWRILKWAWVLLNTEIAITDALMLPFTITIGLVVALIALVIWAFIKWHGVLTNLFGPALQWLSKLITRFFKWIWSLVKSHFPKTAALITKGIDWIVKKFDWLVSKGKAILGFFTNLKKGIAAVWNWEKFGTPEVGIPMAIKKFAGPLGFVPKATLPLGPLGFGGVGSAPLGTAMTGFDLTSILAEAFPTLSEGVETNINIGITSKSDLQIDRVTHSSSSPNVDVGTTMPLAAHGAV